MCYNSVLRDGPQIRGMAVLKLGVDLDGVVVDIVGAMLPHLSLVCGYEVTERDIGCYEFQTALGLDDSQMDRVWNLVEQERLYSRALPVDGAVTYLAELNGVDWRFVTSRPKWTRGVTLDWLNGYGLGHREVVFTSRGKPAAVDLGLNVFIEDDMETALELAGHGVHVLLFDHPWNQASDLPDNCRRVHSWAEIDHEMRHLIVGSDSVAETDRGDMLGRI